MSHPEKAFGEAVRHMREARGIGLRQMARDVGMSAAYLSQIERGVYPPPPEQRIRAIADRLDSHPDHLLGLAGRIPSDIPEAIGRAPGTMTRLIRKLAVIPLEELEEKVLPYVESVAENSDPENGSEEQDSGTGS